MLHRLRGALSIREVRCLSTPLNVFIPQTPALRADCVFLPQGTISVGVDATDLFDRYDEEYEDVSGSGFPQIEINKMHISQSIEVKHRHLSKYSLGLS